MSALTATARSKKNADCGVCPVRPLSFCSAIPAGALEAMPQIKSRVRFIRNQIIACEGEPARSIFNVVQGVVKLIRSWPDGRTQIVGFRVAGEFFATPAFDRYTVTAVAVTDVALCRFSRAKLSRLWNESPALLARLFEMTSSQLLASEDQLFLLGRRTAREKVVAFLLDYAGRTTNGHPEHQRLVNLAMTRVDIADFLGLTLETVSRVFSSLVREGLITVSMSRSIRFADLPALMRIAGT